MDLSRYLSVYESHFLLSWSAASAVLSSIFNSFSLCSTLCDFPLHRRKTIAPPPLHRLHRLTQPCAAEPLSVPLLSLSESLLVFIIVPSCSLTRYQSQPFAAYRNYTTPHLYCIFTTHVCCGELESTARPVCPFLLVDSTLTCIQIYCIPLDRCSERVNHKKQSCRVCSLLPCFGSAIVDVILRSSWRSTGYSILIFGTMAKLSCARASHSSCFEHEFDFEV